MDKKENELIREALNGSDLAFRSILKTYLKPIYNFLYQITPDLAPADNLLNGEDIMANGKIIPIEA